MIHRFNTASPWPTGTLEIIKKFVSGHVLFLESSDLDKNSADWTAQLSQIQLCVQQHNIEKIIIDATMNPERFDEIHNVDVPSKARCLQDLNKLCPTYNVTGDYTYHYRPDHNVKFFPAFLWTISARQVDEYFPNSRHRQYKTVYDTDLIKAKGVMCLNRNLTWHRMYLFSLLAEQPWFDKISYSFLNKVKHRLDTIAVKQHLSDQELAKIASFDHLLPLKIPSELDTDVSDIPVMWMEGASSVASLDYRDHAINLVTETSLTEGIILTEKTCKPFLAYQIPIIVGPVGANEFLQDLGLDMFEDYVPWRTWDSETDHKLKMQKIVEFLSQLLSSNTAQQDILTVHKNFHSRLIYNKQHFHSQGFQNLLCNQLNTCL